jgi:hypothetical protein
MGEIEKYKEEERIIESTMHWSYMLITKQITFDELMELDVEFGLLYHPEDENNNYREIIDTLLDHYIYTEEYEKCQDLVDIKEIY